MSPRKEYFDEPLVKVNLTKARFPKTCPVCGDPATKIALMNITRVGKEPLRPSLDFMYSSPFRQNYRTQQHKLKVLPIQVCAKHSQPAAGSDRYQALCLIVDGLLMAVLFFSLFVIGDSLWRARPIPSWTFFVVGVFGVAMLFTNFAFRPNVLADAVKIVGLDPGMQNILIAFKRLDYREQFMNENQMTAEMVSWIVRSDD